MTRGERCVRASRGGIGESPLVEIGIGDEKKSTEVQRQVHRYG